MKIYNAVVFMALAGVIPAQAAPKIDLGSEGQVLYVCADLPSEPGVREVTGCTVKGEERIRAGINAEGQSFIWVHGQEVSAPAPAGNGLKMVLKIASHDPGNDEVSLHFAGSSAEASAEPGAWMLVNSKGSSRADLSKFSLRTGDGRTAPVKTGASWSSVFQGGGQAAPAVAAAAVPQRDLSVPDPEKNPGSQLMLDLPGVETKAELIDFTKLPILPGEHTVISKGVPGSEFRLHNYLVWHGDRFWCMWSHGPEVEDKAGQHIQYATSADGLVWSEPAVLVGPSDQEGLRYIARGFWVRDDGKLRALISRDEAGPYFGPGLELQSYIWNAASGRWDFEQVVMKDAMNNFPPKKLPSGEWMMTRRDHKRAVSMITGGVTNLNDWQVFPVAEYRAAGSFRPEEPYWYLLPDGKNLVGLFRNNTGKYLLRAFSADGGRSWSEIKETNFPDAISKFNALRTSRGYYVLISNANPKKRNPLFLSVSQDGLVYTRMAILPVPAKEWETLQYPHVIEHDGQLLVAFSTRKRSVEVVRVSLDAVDQLLLDK